MSALPFSQLQAFLVVARRRSFSAAARELGVSRSAASQAVRQLEEQLGVTLLTRTTRSVGMTEAGRRLAERTAPAVAEVREALRAPGSEENAAVGKLRLSVPRVALPFVVEPLVDAFRERHPGVTLEVDVEDRFTDIVADGYDAGIRLVESVERDMIHVRLTGPLRLVVVGAPSYLARRGIPDRPEDLLQHECLTFRMGSTGNLYAWELERGKRSFRVAVRGGVTTSDGTVCAALAERGMGLAYAMEPTVAEAIRSGRLRVVLEAYAPTVPGYFLYFPKQARGTFPLRHLVETARELARA